MAFQADLGGEEIAADEIEMVLGFFGAAGLAVAENRVVGQVSLAHAGRW